MNMKTILILVARIAQIPLIIAAKNENYRVIICDYSENNPGVKYADKYYKIDPRDKDLVLKVAKREKIDGIISNYEEVMPVVAYVAGKMGLVGNDEYGIRTLMSKSGFRAFQRRIGLFAPNFFATDSIDEYYSGIVDIGFPLIVKPVDSSGSRGTTKIECFDRVILDNAFTSCLSYSDKLSVEEYIPMPSLTIIEGDVFIHNNKILWHGLFTNTRNKVFSHIPMLYSLPLELDEERKETIKSDLTKIFRNAGIVHGEYNVEMYFTEDGRLFIVEINVRQGGYEIPIMIKEHSGIDMCRLLVTTAVRDDEYFNLVVNGENESECISQVLVYSHYDGIYENLLIDDAIKKYVIAVSDYKKKGTYVNKVKNISDAVALVRMKYPSVREQRLFDAKIEDLITVKVR